MQCVYLAICNRATVCRESYVTEYGHAVLTHIGLQRAMTDDFTTKNARLL